MKLGCRLMAGLLSVACLSLSHADEINLAGSWRFQLDPQDEGVNAKWYTQTLKDALRLPGSLQEQGFGERPSRNSDWTGGIGIALLDDPRFQRYILSENFQCPFWLTPLKHYVGTAWYQRTVKIPEAWEQKRIVLHLERPHWQTTLWVNDQKVGVQDGLGMAHEYDLTDFLTPGRHTLTIRVDNRVVIPVGPDAHSVTDQTQGNWNGIAGELKLLATDKLWIDDVQVYPDVANRQVRLSIKLGNHGDQLGKGTLSASAKTTKAKPFHAAKPKSWPVEWTADGAELEVTYPLGADALLWDEFSPNVYQLTLELSSGQDTLANASTTFGLRELGIKGSQFTINGRAMFLRGTLECCVFPQTGYPATDVASWKRLIRTCQAHGLNHIRFHSWCPPKAAFIAADELGMMLQAECSAWAVFGDGTAVDTWVHEEAARMLKAYGNHPSFIMMAASNEPHGKKRDEVLSPLVQSWIDKDSRRLYTAGAGWPRLPVNQFHIDQEARLQRFVPLKLDHPPQTAADYRRIVEEYKIPLVTHEIGQWCAYPNISERLKYTGWLRAENLDIFGDLLKRAGMIDQAGDFLLASGMFQTLLYKHEIEATLRTPGQAGFQLLSLQDFPGQGTAPVGVLDAQWGPKGYVTAEEYRRFCNHTVALARLEKFVWLDNETLKAGIDIAHYGPTDLENQIVEWQLAALGGEVYASGQLPATTLRTGQPNAVGQAVIDLSNVRTPSQAIFTVSIVDSDIINEWPIWVYPRALEPASPDNVLFTTEPDEALAALARGERVLLSPNANAVRGNTLGCFRPIFWNRVTFPSQKEHTMGVLCQVDHPALADFPTRFHSEWQWWELFEKSKPMVLDELPTALRPIVQPIDDWNDCRRLAVLFEAQVGQGRLMVCSMDVASELSTRPVAKQLRHSLLSYMSGERFQPVDALTPDQVKSLFKEPTLVQKLGATITADSQEPLHEATQALDDNPRTIWHSAWLPSPAPLPHSLTLDLKQTITLRGLTYLPRQDHGRARIADYEVRVSTDGKNWSEPVAAGTFPNTADLQTVRFASPQTVRYVKLIAKSEVWGENFSSAAEINVIVDP